MPSAKNPKQKICSRGHKFDTRPCRTCYPGYYKKQGKAKSK